MVWEGFRDVRATIEIELTKSEEELWNNLDKDARWGVKKAKKENLIIKEETSPEHIQKFYEIYKETCRYGEITAEPLEEILEKKPRFFFCYKSGNLIAGSAIIEEDNKKFRLFKNASSSEYLKDQPNNMLYWGLIMWGKKNGFKLFDLGGYQLNTMPGDKLYNINRFKKRWGGEIKEYPIYSYNLFYIIGRKIIRNSKFFRVIWNRIKGRPKTAGTNRNMGNIDSYESEKSVEHYDTEYIREIEKSLIDKYFHGRILDLGCGTGRTTGYIFRKHLEVIGADISENLIKRAKKKYPDIKFDVSDACNLNFPAKHFDVVFFSFNGLDYISPEEKRIQAIKEIERVLKPRGLFIFSSHNGKALFFKFRPKFFIRNLFRGTLFSRYKWDKEEFGELYTYYASPKKQKSLIEKNTFLRFVEKMDIGIRDIYPHYVFRKE